MNEESDTPNAWIIFGACLVALVSILSIAITIAYIITREIR